MMPSGWDPRATVRAQPSRRGRYRCEILANGSLASQTGVWVIPTNVPFRGGGWPVLSVGLFSPPLPPLIDPYPRNWTLPGSAEALWGKSHTFIIG
jgi:hypothetical protein